MGEQREGWAQGLQSLTWLMASSVPARPPSQPWSSSVATETSRGKGPPHHLPNSDPRGGPLAAGKDAPVVQLPLPPTVRPAGPCPFACRPRATGTINVLSHAHACPPLLPPARPTPGRALPLPPEATPGPGACVHTRATSRAQVRTGWRASGPSHSCQVTEEGPALRGPRAAPPWSTRVR